MSIYVNNCNKVNDIFININGTKKIISIWVNRGGNPTKVFSTGNKIFDFSNITWADGTDEEITIMLDAHYAGEIDIHDYWHVGDERVIHLSAMSNDVANEKHAEQDISMVLMNKGGKTLVEPINDINECAFIVGQKNCFANESDNSEYSEMGNMNLTDTNSGGWDGCLRRTWCNSTYRNVFPSSFQNLFKQHYNVTASNGGGSSKKTISKDYFALPSDKEIFGKVKYANEIAESDNNQFTYYNTSSNIIKMRAGKPVNYFSRSPSDNARDFCVASSLGTSSSNYASKKQGISPFGVI